MCKYVAQESSTFLIMIAVLLTCSCFDATLLPIYPVIVHSRFEKLLVNVHLSLNFRLFLSYRDEICLDRYKSPLPYVRIDAVRCLCADHSVGSVDLFPEFESKIT